MLTVKKRRRIAELEEQVKQLQEQVQALELKVAAQPWPVVVPMPYVAPYQPPIQIPSTWTYPVPEIPFTTTTGSSTGLKDGDYVVMQ